MARILVAASPEPRAILERILAGHDLVCAETVEQAERLLSEQTFDLIICTVVFDESRMFDLLRLAKSSPAWQRIPFLGTRVRRQVLDSRLALEGIAFTCQTLGAAAFLDYPSYQVDPDREMREAIDRILRLPRNP
jgi:CheY-like chemotaxis protein